VQVIGVDSDMTVKLVPSESVNATEEHAVEHSSPMPAISSSPANTLFEKLRLQMGELQPRCLVWRTLGVVAAWTDGTKATNSITNNRTNAETPSILA